MSERATARPRGPLRVGVLASLALALTFVALLAAADGAHALGVNITSPPSGQWGANATVPVTGTADSPGTSERRMDTNADFTGGSLVEARVGGGFVTHDVPNRETWHYANDFSNMPNTITYIDPFWSNDTGGYSGGWEVDAAGAYSSTPPALYHRWSPVETLSWSAVMPAPIAVASFSLKYGCGQYGTLYVYASRNGLPGSETMLLATNYTNGERTLSVNLTTLLQGSRAAYIRFWTHNNFQVSHCFIDDFDFTAEYVPANGTNGYTYTDRFDAGINSVWYGGGWRIDSEPNVSTSSPSLMHNYTGRTHAWASWGFASSIQTAVVSFKYKCEGNATMTASVGPRYWREVRFIDHGRGGLSTLVTFNATPVVGGWKSMYLHLSAEGIGLDQLRCAIDNLTIAWTFDASQGVDHAGSYRSQTLDLGAVANISGLTWAATVPATTRFEIAVALSSNNASFTPFQTLWTSGQPPSQRTARYVQVRILFHSYGGIAEASLDWFSIRYGALSAVEWSVGGGPWSPANGTAVWNASVALPVGMQTVSIRVRDMAGSTVVKTLFIGRDATPPTEPGQADALATVTVPRVTFSWAASTDVGSGFSHYLVYVSTDVDGADVVVALRSDQPSVTMEGLAQGVTYYARVLAVDRVGRASTFANASSGTFTDFEGPGPVAALTGGAPYATVSSLTWTWGAANDTGSGVASYRVRVGTTPGGSEVAATDVAALEFTVSSLQDGVYYATVSAVDAVSNVGAPVAAAPIMIDTHAPASLGLVSGPPEFTRNTTLRWSWTESADAGSGLAGYEVRLGTEPGGSDIGQWTGSAPAFGWGGLAPGQPYYLSVTPADRAGNRGTTMAVDPSTIDTAAPGVPSLGTVAAQQRNATLRLTWSEASDEPAGNASGIGPYIVTILRSGAQPDVRAVTGTSLDLDLVDGAHYTVSVRAVDVLGNGGPESEAVTTFEVDATTPSAPGSLGVRSERPSTALLWVTWAPSLDATSGVAYYRIAVGTAPGLENVTAWTPVNGTRFSFEGVRGQTYFVRVVAVDRFGNEGEIASASFEFPAVPVEREETTSAPPPYTTLIAAGVAAAVGVVVMLVVRRRRAAAGKVPETAKAAEQPAPEGLAVNAPPAPSAGAVLPTAAVAEVPTAPVPAAAVSSGSAPETAPCPDCGAPVTVGTPKCPACGLEIAWG